jgi:hypothetical protein
MKFSVIAVLALAGSAVAKEMADLMAIKTAQRNAQRTKGLFRKGRWNKRFKGQCRNGKSGEYACNNVDLQDFLSHEQMGSETREGNDVWGML